MTTTTMAPEAPAHDPVLHRRVFDLEPLAERRKGAGISLDDMAERLRPVARATEQRQPSAALLAVWEADEEPMPAWVAVGYATLLRLPLDVLGYCMTCLSHRAAAERASEKGGAA